MKRILERMEHLKNEIKSLTELCQQDRQELTELEELIAGRKKST